MPKTKPKTFTREALLRDPAFAQYQPDFLAAVLKNPTYTKAEAAKAVEAFFHAGKEAQ